MKTWLTILTIVLALILLGGCHGAINKDAENALREDLGCTGFTVFPTFVRAKTHTYDETSARRLIELIEKEQFGTAVFRDERIDFPGDWGMNQAKMYQESCASIALHLQNRPIETEYAVVAEFLIGTAPDGTPLAGGIHAYVLDCGGRPAAGVALNSHNKLFASAKPKSTEDCTQVLCAAAKEKLVTLRDSPKPETK